MVFFFLLWYGGYPSSQRTIEGHQFTIDYLSRFVSRWLHLQPRTQNLRVRRSRRITANCCVGTFMRGVEIRPVLTIPKQLPVAQLSYSCLSLGSVHLELMNRSRLESRALITTPHTSSQVSLLQIFVYPSKDTSWNSLSVAPVWRLCPNIL